MDEKELLQNADFLDIAMEQMEDDTVAYEFVEDVYGNLVEAANEGPR
jgi:hypothetical protein